MVLTKIAFPSGGGAIVHYDSESETDECLSNIGKGSECGDFLMDDVSFSSGLSSWDGSNWAEENAKKSSTNEYEDPSKSSGTEHEHCFVDSTLDYTPLKVI